LGCEIVGAVAGLPHGTVTTVFTDIEGSTSLLRKLGKEAYLEELNLHRALLRDAFGSHGGREVEMQGDSFHFAFASASQAVVAAAEAQRALADASWPHGEPIRVRVGIHTGEPSAAEDLYVGLDIHRAARVMSAAHGGQVLLSETTALLTREELPPELPLRDLGHYHLKDLVVAQRLYQLGTEEFPPLRTGEMPMHAEKPARVQTENGRARYTPRRNLLLLALMGVIAAGVAIPLFALGSRAGPGKPPNSNPVVATVEPDDEVYSENFLLVAPDVDRARSAVSKFGNCDQLVARCGCISLLHSGYRAGAVHADALFVRLLVEGNTPGGATIVDMHPRIVGRSAPLKGAAITCGQSAGAESPIRMTFDLDQPNPVARLDPQGSLYFGNGHVVHLKKGEVVPFLIDAYATHDYVQWKLEADVVVDGKRQTLLIDDHGKPFRTSASRCGKGAYAPSYDLTWRGNSVRRVKLVTEARGSIFCSGH
jgi:class 3 adenylate cyclase